MGAAAMLQQYSTTFLSHAGGAGQADRLLLPKLAPISGPMLWCRNSIGKQPMPERTRQVVLLAVTQCIASIAAPDQRRRTKQIAQRDIIASS